MDEKQRQQSEEAFRWMKTNQHNLVVKFVESIECIPDPQPTTLFMAGSPGAGKTEISKRFIARFKQKPVRIDADEIRSICPGYTGADAHIFQKAATKGVHILYDYALKRKLNVILDGTFAYSGALENIRRSLKYKRRVEIFFVYQDPIQAWEFTKKREAIEQRMVSKEVFINAFFKSRENVNKAKKDFSNAIELNLIIKDFEKNLEQLQLNIQSVDPYIKKVYTIGILTNLLV